MANDNTGKWIALGVVALVAVTAIGYFFFPFLAFTEERDAGAETVEQSYDADEALQTYQEFRRLHEDIKSQREQIANQRDALDRFYEVQGENPDEWSRQARERHSRIQQRITGYQNQLDDLVGEYNTMSRTANEELFKCNLPYQVDDRLDIRGPPGSEEADQAIQDVDVNGDPVPADAEVPPAEQCDGLPDQIQREAST